AIFLRSIEIVFFLALSLYSTVTVSSSYDFNTPVHSFSPLICWYVLTYIPLSMVSSRSSSFFIGRSAPGEETSRKYAPLIISSSSRSEEHTSELQSRVEL